MMYKQIAAELDGGEKTVKCIACAFWEKCKFLPPWLSWRCSIARTCNFRPLDRVPVREGMLSESGRVQPAPAEEDGPPHSQGLEGDAARIGNANSANSQRS